MDAYGVVMNESYRQLPTSVLVLIVAIIRSGRGQVGGVEYNADLASAELNRRLPVRIYKRKP